LDRLTRGKRKERIGFVVSDSMDKSVTVLITRTFQHPVFKRIVKRKKKFIAHDANNSCGLNDIVRIRETRPLSRHKRWKVVEIVEKAK